MHWVYKLSEQSLKKLKKLDVSTQKSIFAYLDKHVKGDTDPRRFGKRLTANLAGTWRYRVGDYRIICKIRDHELIVVVISVGHRKNVYD